VNRTADEGATWKKRNANIPSIGHTVSNRGNLMYDQAAVNSRRQVTTSATIGPQTNTNVANAGGFSRSRSK
jgi:hypothetical protein